LAHLPNLERLDVRWNRLTSLPEAFHPLRERGCLVYA